MNKKGFTLIELLAVIVVLAIIALIATPIVMRLISDVQEGADARSVEGYMKAYEGAYYNYMLKNGGRIPTETLELTKSDYSGVTVICEGITVIDGKFTAICSVEGHDGRYKYENGHAIKIDNERVEGSTPDSPSTPSEPEGPTDPDTPIDPETPFDPTAVTIPEGKMCVLIEETANLIGAKYVCNPGDGNRVFYVLENNTVSNELSLILDSNYDNTTQPWCSNSYTNTCGADGLTDKLNDIRNAWSYLFEDQIDLPRYDQIYNVNRSEDLSSTLWLYDNLDNDSNTPYVEGYWTDSSHSTINSYAFRIEYSGYLKGMSVSVSGYYGIRPVITVSKNQISP